MTKAPEIRLTSRPVHSAFDREVWETAKSPKNSRAFRLVSTKNSFNIETYHDYSSRSPFDMPISAFGI